MQISDEIDPVLKEKICRKARLDFNNVQSFARALLRGRVSDEIRKERDETCKKCYLLCKNGSGSWCSICGCKTAVGGMIKDLTIYKEGEAKEDKLCHHYERASGEGWKR